MFGTAADGLTWARGNRLVFITDVLTGHSEMPTPYLFLLDLTRCHYRSISFME
jgi:hypothetical protein